MKSCGNYEPFSGQETAFGELSAVEPVSEDSA